MKSIAVILIISIATIFLLSFSLTHTLIFISLLILFFAFFMKFSVSSCITLIFFINAKVCRLNVRGKGNFPKRGPVLLLGNYSTIFDCLVLLRSSPRRVCFVLEKKKFLNKKWCKLINIFFNVTIVNHRNNEKSYKIINELLKKGKVVALFLEKKNCRDVRVHKFSLDLEKITEKRQALILPFYLQILLDNNIFLRKKGKSKLCFFQTVKASVIYGEPLPKKIAAEEIEKRAAELSIKSWQAYSQSLGSIQLNWLKQSKALGGSFCITDHTEKMLSYDMMIALVMILTRELKPFIKNQKNIGIILPPSIAGVLTNISLLCLGRKIVNLNYTLGEQFLLSTIKQANIKTVITSSSFIEKLKIRGIVLEEILSKLSAYKIEDFSSSFSKFELISYLTFVKITPFSILKFFIIKNESPGTVAAILFSSGSEGEPKGIELTHENILANVKQVFSMIDSKKNDVMLTALPLFHAFGLTTTAFLPLLEGIPLICTPDLTDAFAIGELVSRYRITIMCAVSSIYGLYARHSKLTPQMFKSLRLVIAGAEKLSRGVRILFKEKFSLDIFEGYGATELSPVVSVNLPNTKLNRELLLSKPGTVGLPLPGTVLRIVDPQNYASLSVGEEGLILIAGPQIMYGYLKNSSKTEEVLMKKRGILWYKSGDKGRIDKDGFLTIVDRYSRFIKIMGESISLNRIEEIVMMVVEKEDFDVMAIALPDIRKGEKIVLLHLDTLDSETIRQQLLKAHIKPIMLPSSYLPLFQLPMLGNGKKNYLLGKQIALRFFKKES